MGRQLRLPYPIIKGEKMRENVIYNEDCQVTMNNNISENSIDCIITSPFYNTNKKQGDKNTLTNSSVSGYTYLRYDVHIDNLTDDEYCEFTKGIFNQFDRILKKNGVVLYNLSYGNNNREGMFKCVNTIIMNTNFTIADVICWKKKNALPNNCSSNKLTRICEYIFVFCRKSEIDTFNCNKEVISYRKTGQKSYSNMMNFIEAKNNDESCPYNKATFSSELVEKLLEMYCPKSNDSIVYDPFIGSGTTAIACIKYGVKYIGSEISEKQCEWANKRINNVLLLQH